MATLMRLRFSRRYITTWLVVPLAAFVVVALVLGALIAPFFYGAAVAGVLGGGLNVLLAVTGAYSYVQVAPPRVSYRLRALGMPLNLKGSAELHYGDALVVTSNGLFIWRSLGRGYERVDVDPELIDPDDWDRLRTWAASIWPQPPDFSHRSSVIE